MSKQFLRIFLMFGIRLLALPAMLMAVWNKIAWEFNLPQFTFGFFVAVCLVISLCRMCQMLRTAFQNSEE